MISALLIAACCALSARGATDTAAVQALLAGAREHEKAGRIDNAAELRARAIEQMTTDEERVVQWLAIAELHRNANRPHHEAHALRQGLSALAVYDPRHWPTLTRLVDLYRETLDRPGDVLEVLAPLIEGLEPGRGDLRVWIILAETLHGMGDTDRARSIYHKLLRTVGTDAGDQRQHLLKMLELCRSFSPAEASFNRDLRTAALLSQFKTHINDRKWEEANAALLELLTNYRDAALQAREVDATGPRRVVADLLAGLSAEARTAYAERHARALADVIRSAKIEAIEHFAYTHPWPPFRGPLMMAAGDAMMREQRFSRAAACYREAADALLDDQQAQLAGVKAARAAILAGETPEVDLSADPKIDVGGETLSVGEAITRWQDAFGRPQAEPVESVPLPGMHHDRLRLLQAPLTLRKWQAGVQPDRFGWEDNPKMTQAFVPYRPVGDHRQVFINTSEMVYAIDPVAGRLLWTREPSELFTSETLPPHLKDNLLSVSPKHFYVATSPDAVFFSFNWGDREADATRSAVFAARRDDGSLVWSTENIRELAGMRFVSGPAYADGTVVVAAWEPQKLPVFHLVGLDAVTGALLWRTHLYSGSMFPAVRDAGLADIPLAAPPPAIADGAVYFTSATGVMACVDLFNGQVQWLQRYRRVHEYGWILKNNPTGRWAGRFLFNRPDSVPVICGHQVLAAPKDFRGIHFFETGTGKHLREYESIDFRAMIGADDERVYVQEGGSVAAVHLEDADVVWETVIPTSMFIGSPTLSARGLVCTTRDGIFVLSPSDGRILERVEVPGWEAPGNPLDLGDRLVTVSPSAVHLFSPDPTHGEKWSTPHQPESSRLTVEVTAPTSVMRWALPAPDRGDFFLSQTAPDLMVLRSWESFQLRETDPAPSLRWEFPAPSWPLTIQFDRETLLLSYPDGGLIGVDMKTGRARFDRHDPSMSANRDAHAGALPMGDVAAWFSFHRLRIIRTSDGQTLWDKPVPKGLLRGVCPLERGIGIIVESDEGPYARLLDRQTGEELESIPLHSPGSKNKSDVPVRAARRDGQNVLAALPMALVNWDTIARIDFDRGQAGFTQIKPSIPHAQLLLKNKTLCLVGDKGIANAWTWPDLVPLKIKQAGAWTIHENAEFYAKGRRIFAWDMRRGEPLWQTRAFDESTHLLTVSDNTLLAAQNSNEPAPERSRVIAVDTTNGDVIGDAPGLARHFHKLGADDQALFAFDAGYLYRFAPAKKQAASRIRISQRHADPDAIAAVKVARDLNADQREPLAPSPTTPTVDADLQDWADGAWTRLSWPNDWLPDHVLLRPDRHRRPTGRHDLAAEVAIAQNRTHVFVAVRVQDDEHDASPDRPLWRGDSVRLAWRRIDQPRARGSLEITLAVADHVPFVEVGPVVTPTRVMPTVESWPAWLQYELTRQEVPWLRRYVAHAEPMPGIRFAARRHETAAETIYELALPATMLPPPRGGEHALRWDLVVNEADGNGREGGLALGSGSWQLTHPIGYVKWPALPDEAAPSN